jgi:hypothetical protein
VSLLANISQLEAPLRKGYVNFRNRRLLSRYVLAPIWMVSGILRTVLGGLWNAEQLNRPTTSADPGSLLFDAQAGDQSLCLFMLRLAEIPVDTLPPKSPLDVILNLSADCQPGPYATLARHFRGALNLHLAWTDKDAQNLVRTVALSGSSGQAGQSPEAAPGEPLPFVRADMVGRLRPRQIYANAAREYFKSVDWSSRFCVISASAALPTEVIFAALDDVDPLSQGWRFVLLGAEPPEDWKRKLGLISVPSYSGLDLAMQMALVMEADAYCGELNKFGLAALLAGRPAAILREPAASEIKLEPIASTTTFSSATYDAVREQLVLLTRWPDLKV